MLVEAALLMIAYLASFVYTDNVTKMTNRLKNDIDNINVSEFIKMLKYTDSVIAGSYPLQVYHDETWKGSDIDIFTTSTEMKEYMDKKFKNGVSLKRENIYYDEIKRGKNNYDITMSRISEVIDYNTPKINIQLIMVENIEKIIDITQNFDFDFCKTTFDGEEFNITDEGKNKIGNYSLKDSKTVLGYFRLIKYEKRGFTVLNRDKFNHNEIVKLYKRNL